MDKPWGHERQVARISCARRDALEAGVARKLAASLLRHTKMKLCGWRVASACRVTRNRGTWYTHMGPADPFHSCGVCSHNLAISPGLCPPLRPSHIDRPWCSGTPEPSFSVLFCEPFPSPSPITPHSLIRSLRSSPHIGSGPRSMLSRLIDGRQLPATAALCTE